MKSAWYADIFIFFFHLQGFFKLNNYPHWITHGKPIKDLLMNAVRNDDDFTVQNIFQAPRMKKKKNIF